MKLPHITLYTKQVSGGKALTFISLINPKYRDDEGLHEHEKTHILHNWCFALVSAIGLLTWAQLDETNATYAYWALAVCPFIGNFVHLVSRRFRLWAEVKAYRVQLRYSPQHLHHFVRFLVDNYNLKINDNKAKRLLIC
ncbi:MAG: hypothetical protein Alis3KO_01090 [Aliiglaciecola sp.]